MRLIVANLAASLIVATCWIAVTNAQEVYKTVDEKGKVRFTDKPSGNSEAVDTTLQNLHKPIRTVDFPEAKQKTEPSSYQLSLNSPSANQKVGPAAHDLTLSASVSPKLSSGDRIVFYINGSAVSKKLRKSSTSVAISRNMRGKNTASARIVSTDGRTLQTTGPVTFYVIRAN